MDAKTLESDDHALLAYLDSHIAHLEQRVLALKERRDGVKHRIYAPKQALPPIQCLPDDTLLDIFFHCTPLYSGRSWSDSFTRSMNSLDTCNAPWSLSQVCQRWRDICLSSRMLWCFVGVDLGGMLWVGPAEQYRLKLHLERSGDLELYVNLSVHAVSEYNWRQDNTAALRQEEAVRRQLLDVLKATTRRWKGLRIHLPRLILHDFSDCTFDSLQELLVQYPLITNLAASLPVFEGFSTAPRLRTFAVLENLSRTDRLMIPRIALSQITDLGNTPSPAWIAIEHLRKMVNLQRLNFGAIWVPLAGISGLNGGPITLPSLTFLSISRAIQFRDRSSLSDVVRAPALKHLRVGESIGLGDLCDSRMFRTVTRLEIVNMNFTVSSYGLYQFLLVTPNVEHFEISSHLSVEFFEQLTLSDRRGHTNLLPRLRVLDITEAEYAVALDDCILDMLESRRAVLQELHTCTGFSWVGGRPDSSRWQRVRQVVRIVHTRETFHLDELGVDYDDDEDDDDSDYVPGTDSESEYTSGMTDEDDEEG
ncbi:hypothetical protein BDZ89DRAFT_1059902 [Hymenopellis radicata]|nr:hypothetical protein BDZ89DRAFT_1059902 [Hymenopellis radicata]